MRYLSEFRDPQLIKALLHEINSKVTQPWKIMEVCGGQTHSIIKSGIDRLLDSRIELLHGPGCPVCVTPLDDIELALSLSQQPEVIFCSYGDMLRVPGKSENLLMMKSRGAQVELLYSPLDALLLAEKNPSKEVVFWSVGFETTAPAAALTVERAKLKKVANFSVLISHVQVPPAMELLVSDPDCQISAFLAAGHVCAITGDADYHDFVRRHQIPVVITGFEPTDLLQGISFAIDCLENKTPKMINQYSRAVKQQGNQLAQESVSRVFQKKAQAWRGVGVIPESGLQLRDEYLEFCVRKKFPILCKNSDTPLNDLKPELCQSGLLMQGKIKPHQCPQFGKSCTPENPLGAPMVSSEGACSAYYQNSRFLDPAEGTA